MKLKNIMVLGTMMATLAACSVDYPSAPGSGFGSGNADYSNYVAIGNSLTAGFQNGGLREVFQTNSYPAIISGQLGIESFEQPTIADSGTTGSYFLTGFSTSGKPVLYLYGGATTPNNLAAASYQNLGIPGIFLYDFLGATASTNGTSWQNIISLGTSNNPLIDVVLRGQGSVYQQAKAQSPTFVTFWLGNNDILGYATSGAGNNGDPVAAGVSPFTAVDDPGIPSTPLPGFRTMYNRAMDSLAALGVDAVVANIPNVATIPFMTTVKVTDVDSAQVSPTTKIKVYFQEDQAEIKYYLLTLSSALPTLLANGIGTTPGNPVPGKYTITNAEADIISNVVAAYNGVIDSAASRVGFPVVDANQLLADIFAVSGTAGAGYPIGSGIRVKSDYISGGLFSLDGVHPNTLGYAIIANEFIKAANAHYGSSIPLVNLSDYIVQ